MDPKAEIKKSLLDKWSFSWPIMNVLMSGRSSIDLPEIQIANRDEATRFVRCYGYDPEKQQDARLIHAVMVESLGFIERQLMPKEWKQGVIPPSDIIQCQDIRDLLLWACDRSPESNQRRMWACAVMRVMHTIAHIEGAFRYTDIDAARDEIMARFQSVLSYREDKVFVASGEHMIPLVKLEWKNQKSRESVLLKLLHKRANVAETIYDMIGVRLVTETRSDSAQLVKMLYRSHVISFPNAIPSRSRNSLVDLDVLRTRMDDLRGELMTQKITPEIFEKKVMELNIEPPPTAADNSHSGDLYSAIQLTGRQLVRHTKPLTILKDRLQELSQSKNVTKELALCFEEMTTVMNNIARIGGDEEFAFFPFEIQIMDRQSWENNTHGKASHSRYKRSQIRAARRRVLNEILPLS